MSKEREIKCYFGILNLRGLMNIKNHEENGTIAYSEVEKPIFSTETYTIKTTFNRKLRFQGQNTTSQYFGKLHFDSKNDLQDSYYQKKFRRDVLWDFGDGTQVLGYSAEHTYKKPGRYKISCTFFDINRRAWTNKYHIYVIVKEIIPTVLRFDDSYTKKQIYCSKIQRITRVQALTSNTVVPNLTVNCQRIFSKEQHQNNYQEIDKTFDKLPDTTFRFMDKYWGFMENTQVLYYNSDKVHSNYLKPSDNFTPRYTDLYGKFYYNEQKDIIDVAIYQLIPYKNIDDYLKVINILDPNSSILSFEQETYIEVSITQVYTQSQIPSGVVFIGRRGYCDVFYRNDFIGHKNTVRFSYNLDETNITSQLVNTTNYINMNPVGLSFDVKHNQLDNIKIGISTDGFLRDLEQYDGKESFYVDPHLYNTLYKGIDLDLYIFPFILYDDQFYIEGADDLVIDVYQGGFETYNKMYYVPKDLNLDLKATPIIDKSRGNSTFVNHGLVDIFGDATHLNPLYADYIIGINPWFFRVPIVIQDYINIRFDVLYSSQENADYINVSSPTITKFGLKSQDEIIIPKRKAQYASINQLINVLMIHPMFKQADNLKDALRAVFGNDLLSRLMTQSVSILDDTNNIKTCYLSNLLSILKMMGQEVTQFEKGAFDSNNEMKDFVRLLSMNHTDLVGHEIEEQYDIKVNNAYKGVNVGDQIDVEDILSLNQSEGEHLGKVIGVKKVGSSKVKRVDVVGGVHLIMVDRYTNLSKEITLYHVQNQQKHNSITIGDYEAWWGWNLLLPASFDTLNKKIAENQEKMRNPAYSRSARQGFQKNIQDLKKKKRDLIKGYYRFFLLNPKRKTKRIGNFIDDAYITHYVENPEKWDDKWGITHDVLMKILIKNCFLKNNRTIGAVNEDSAIKPNPKPQPLGKKEINVTQHLGGDGSEIIYNVTVNGKTRTDVTANGEVSITGEINGQGKSTLLVSSNDCIIDGFASFRIIPNILEVRVNYDGSIDENYQTFVINGNNVHGKVTVWVKNTEISMTPKFEITMDIDFIDERMGNEVVFNSNNIETQMRDYFFSSKKRMQLDSSYITSGIVDNTHSTADGRRWDVSLRFINSAKLGDNQCLLNFNYVIGKTDYDGLESTDINEIQPKNSIETIVNIDYGGYISFKDKKLIVPVTETISGNYVKGNLYFVLSGNAVDGSHKLTCYTYDPDGDVTSDRGLQTIHAETGGHYYKINHRIQGSNFIVNERNGLQDGYYCVVKSNGDYCGKPGLVKDVADVKVKIFNSNNECVYTKELQRAYQCDVDENGYVWQNNFILTFNDNLKGSIAFGTYGGYYEIIGYDLNLNLK